MTQSIALTAGTSGTNVGFNTTGPYGSITPTAVYSLTVLQVSHDSATDELTLRLNAEVAAADWMNLLVTDGEAGLLSLEFSAAARNFAGGITTFTWSDVTAPFAAAGVYDVVFNPLAFNCECDDGLPTETLGDLRERMMIRLGFAAQKDNPPPGMSDLLNDFLQSAQKFLYKKYPGTRTERFFTWPMLPGVRYYGIGDNDDVCTKTLNAMRRTWVGVEDSNGTWYPMVDGIPPEFYTSVENEGLPTRYEIRQCIEVFPAPDAAYRLCIKGHFDLLPFTADGDTTTIDAELVFLWALANAKAHYGKEDAGTVAAQAREYLAGIVGEEHGTKRYIPNTTPAAPWTKPVMRDGFDG